MTLKIKFFFERMPLIQRKHFMVSEPTKSIKNLLASHSEKWISFKNFQDNHGNLGEGEFLGDFKKQRKIVSIPHKITQVTSTLSGKLWLCISIESKQ